MKIDIYFDTICPWCWVGKHNLETAIKQSGVEEFELNYKTFFLYEGIPPEGVVAKDHLRKKYNLSPEQEKEYLDRLVTTGREAGVEFNLNSFDFIPNTIASHILMKLVPKDERSSIIEKLFFEIFNQNKNIGDIEVLKKFATDNKISVAEFEAALLDNSIKDKLMQEYTYGRTIGVKGVPFYVINDKYAIYGAQKPEIFLQTFNRILDEDNQVTLM